MRRKQMCVLWAVLASTAAFVCNAAEGDALRSQEIIGIEKAALDRWGQGDPQGYIDLFASDITYFNPFEKRRLDGSAAMTAYYGAVAGQIHVDRYEMIEPKVQWIGDAAILTYHLYNYRTEPDGTETETTRWNSTKVYVRVGDDWRILHNHWSFLQPDVGATRDEE